MDPTAAWHGCAPCSCRETAAVKKQTRRVVEQETRVASSFKIFDLAIRG